MKRPRTPASMSIRCSFSPPSVEHPRLVLPAVQERERDLGRVVHPHEVLALHLADRLLVLLERQAALRTREDISLLLKRTQQQEPGTGLCARHQAILRSASTAMTSSIAGSV